MARKVGLIGIPGSGKSALAKALEEHYVKNDECECRTPVAIIDDYVGDAESRMDLAGSFEGSYISNVNIAMERLGRERSVGKFKTVITCGTLIETSTYMAMEFESRQQFWTTDEEKQDNAKRIQAGVQFLACLYMDSFRYDKVYYLPPVLSDGDVRLATLDRHLQAAFQAFWITPTIPLVTEGGGSLEEITQKRVELVEKEESGKVPSPLAEASKTE